MTTISTLRPGLLVSLKTSLQGNVTYRTRDIEPEHMTGEGTLRATWETDRTVRDPAEHEAGVKARSKARSLVTAVCSESTFGLLCPEDYRARLMDAIDEARVIAERFNANATITRLQVSVIVGRVASDDIEAVRAINGEVTDLMNAMERGLRNLDVTAVRDAANKAKALSNMLSPDASAKAQRAIEVARSAARQIVKAGETAAVAIDERAIKTIRESRLAFLDLDDAAEIEAPAPASRGIDFDAPPVAMAAAAFAQPALEF